MKQFRNFICVFTLICLTLGCFAGCQTESGGETTTGAPAETTVPATTGQLEIVDYAAAVKLDMSSETVKEEVSVKTFIDGDTTHFYISSSAIEGGVLKGRYLAINTPESTGKIEEWGKKASVFTKSKLSEAVSIIVESDDGSWNVDSTGERHLVWVWYKTSESEDYRNLNIEILQNGLALPNSSANNRYGETCMAAIAQAKAQKLNIYSGEQDPDYYYGEAVELTLKELRTNIADYTGISVAFNGIVTMNYSNGVYVEDYDGESGIYYGMYVYYGAGANGNILDMLTVGNEVRIVGSVQYWEAGGSYQVAGLAYKPMQPNDPGNVQKLSSGHEPAYVETSADTFVNGKVEVEMEEEVLTFDYAELVLNTSIRMNGLYVKSVYTTKNEDSDSYGAMTLTCEVDGITVSVRTNVLYDENGEMITADAYLGKTIDVMGIVDYYDGGYQIKVCASKYIIITNE